MKRIIGAVSLVFASWMSVAADSDIGPFESQSAESKFHMLKDLIFQGGTAAAPGASKFKKLAVLSPSHLTGAFTINGDIMPSDRVKVIHDSGSIIEVAFDVVSTSGNGLTGIFASGAQHGFLRFSVAENPKNNNWKPGFAIKLLRDGKPSANIIAMHSLDGIDQANLLSVNFFTAIVEPTGFVLKNIVGPKFQKAVDLLGVENGTPLALSCDDMARFNEAGIESVANAPYSLIFRPTKAARELLNDYSGDFRDALEGKGRNIVLFKVYAFMKKDDQSAPLVGSIRTTSAFRKKHANDEELFFKHPMPHSNN